MPSNLDLDRLKATLAKYKNLWMDDANALIAEVERLTQELATAKAVGAVSGVRVERIERDNYIQFHSHTCVWGYVYRDGRKSIFADGLGGMPPAEAREFAAAIIAVADAVEKEGGE